MAKSTGLQQRLFVAGYDISGDAGAINNASSPRGTQEAPGIDSAGMERIMTTAGGELEFAHWFNKATGQVHDALSGLPTGNVHAMWVLGTSIGDVVEMVLARQINYDWTENEDKSLQGTTQMVSDGVAPEWGVMLTAGLRTDSADTNGSSQNNGGSSSNGLAAQVQATAFSGTSVTIAIEESSDDGATDAFTSVATFTAVSSANTTERVTASGAVEQYLRVATSGTFSSVTFAVAVRRGTANDDTAY